jgi:aspartate/methionine/tyrosine aminotransferase
MRISRRSGIAPFLVTDVLKAAYEHAASGAHVLHLEAGEPSGPPPPAVRAAAQRALDEQRIGYTEPLGLPELRARIARHYGERYGRDISPARVIVTTGASGAFLLAFLASFDAGARVGVTEPGYPAYRNILKLLDIEPVTLSAGADTRFQPTPGLLSTALPLDGFILQSPANPTGTMLSKGELGALLGAREMGGITLIADEIYHGITYEEPAETALAYSDDVIVINSFSKYFCMTGFRVGWMVVPEALVRTIERLSGNLFISPNALSQYAALAAFDARDELNARVGRYAENRKLLLETLPRLGFGVLAPPQGAFYLYTDVSRLTNDSGEFCAKMLAEAGVAATPGIDFDPLQGRRAVRFSFAGSKEEIVEAVQRLSRWRA